MQKRSKKDMINGEVEPRIDSQRGVLSDNAPTVSAVSGSNFVISGKNIAPALRSAADICSDDALVGLALNGHELEDIANTVGVPAAELTLRLVELRTGPLGCIRPAADDSVPGLFADVKLRPSRLRIMAKQKPVLSLVALAFGRRLQRLGDRLYLAGEETTLPRLVRLARDEGVRIRYPKLDPMDDAWNTGPSRHDSPVSRRPGWL